MPATGKSAWDETILHRFPNSSDSTQFSLAAGVVLGKSGHLYGTTPNLGKNTVGTVFELTP